jgi:hypothetical protein
VTTKPTTFGGLLLLVLGWFPAACSDATGTTRGGEPRFDAAPPSMPVPPQPASDASRDVEAGRRGGFTFTELYRDILGDKTTAKASCSHTAGSCHGDASEQGAVSSFGYVCPSPAGPSPAQIAAARTACYDSLKTGPAGMIQGGAWKQTRLYGVLRKANGEPSIGAAMPLQPNTVTLTDDDLGRLEDWFAAGAKND